MIQFLTSWNGHEFGSTASLGGAEAGLIAARIARAWTPGIEPFTDRVAKLRYDAAGALVGVVTTDPVTGVDSIASLGGGATAYASLTDKDSADLPTINAPLATALSGKAGILPPLTLVDADFSSNNINLTKAAHLNRLLIIDKTAAGTLTWNNDATGGSSGDDSLIVYVRGAGPITVTPGSGTVIAPTGASGPFTLQPGARSMSMRTAANTLSSMDAVSSKFEVAASSPSMCIITENGSTTTQRMGQASTSELDSATYVATSSTDGASPFTEMRRGRWQAAASAQNRIAGSGMGTSMLKIASKLNWPALVLGSIDDASFADGSFFMGAASAAPSTLTTVEPSAITTTRVGLHCDTGQANLRMMSYGSGGASAATDLGANFARARFTMWGLALWASEDGATIYAQACNLNTGALSAVFAYTGTTAPSTTAFLKLYVARSSLAVVSAFQAQVGWGGFYTGKWNGGRVGF